MELGTALALVARQVSDGQTTGDQLAVRARSALLEILGGRPVPGLAPQVQEALQHWLQTQYGAVPDAAGALYQATLGWAVEREADGGISVHRNRRGHRATGAYYTLDAVVDYMIARARHYMPEATALIDPACGSGAFLKGARRGYGSQLSRLTGLDADPQALALCRGNVPEAELHRVDALLDQVGTGYDLCLGNPPYISSGLRGAATPDRERHEQLRRRYAGTAQYKVNTYPLFVERGLELVRPGGVLGFILPDSFLAGRYFAGMRQLLLRHALLELTLIREDFWEHGRVGQSVILFVRKEPPAESHRVLVKAANRVSDLFDQPAVPVSRAELTWGPLERFRLLPETAERSFVQALEAGAGPLVLGDVLRTYSGLIARGGQQSFLRSANPALAGPWGKVLRSGREIDRYRLAWAGEEVCLDRELIKSGGHLPFYQRPKLLLRQTADSLRACYDETGVFCLNNIHVLAPLVPGLDLRTLLGLINSAPLNRYYKAVTMETGRLYAQVDLDVLQSLPLPSVSDEAASALARLARARENATPGEAASLEAAIDDWVMRCYGLA